MHPPEFRIRLSYYQTLVSKINQEDRILHHHKNQ